MAGPACVVHDVSTGPSTSPSAGARAPHQLSPDSCTLQGCAVHDVSAAPDLHGAALLRRRGDDGGQLRGPQRSPLLLEHGPVHPDTQDEAVNILG